MQDRSPCGNDHIPFQSQFSVIASSHSHPWVGLWLYCVMFFFNNIAIIRGEHHHALQSKDSKVPADPTHQADFEDGRALRDIIARNHFSQFSSCTALLCNAKFDGPPSSCCPARPRKKRGCMLTTRWSCNVSMIKRTRMSIWKGR